LAFLKTYNKKKNKMHRKPTKLDSFYLIRSLNIPTETIIDVGVQYETPELRLVFSDKKQILFEPVLEFHQSINKKYADIEYQLFGTAISDFDGESYIKKNTVIPSQAISHSRLVDSSDNQKLSKVPTARLDTIIPSISCKSPYLLKIDVDGIELKILNGALKTLDLCNVIVIEANIKTVLERMQFIIDKGFSLFDIVDFCYYDDRLRQFDLIFLNNKIIDELSLDFYKQKFDINKWIQYDPK